MAHARLLVAGEHPPHIQVGMVLRWVGDTKLWKVLEVLCELDDDDDTARLLSANSDGVFCRRCGEEQWIYCWALRGRAVLAEDFEV